MADQREEVILTPEQTHRHIQRLAEQLHRDIVKPEKRVVVGIRRGGAVVAELLRQRLNGLLNRELPMGTLDITFYRDDLATVGPNPVVAATELPDIDDKRVILVDDVLFTGRTIRAALNALFDFGRPEMVDLVVLVDRGHHQLPIRADYVGLQVNTCKQESIKLLHGEGHPPLTVVRRFPPTAPAR